MRNAELKIAPPQSEDAGLRVLLVSRALPAHVPGGLERHVHDLALGLASAGCSVHLLTAPLPLAARPIYESHGITLHSMAFARPSRYTLGYLLRAGGAINQILARQPIDVLHAQEFALGFWNPPPPPSALPVPPLVLTVHGTITSETPLHPDIYRALAPAARLRAWLRYGRRFLYAPAWRRALHRADSILVDSAFTLSELERQVPAAAGRVHCVPLGVRESGAPPPPRDDARAALGWSGLHLLTTGRLEWQKGHEIALEALATLRHLPWHYTIAGAGAYGDTLSRAVARLALADRVTLAGWVPEETKARMLSAADLFLWPERTHPAFGLAGLESLLSGTPVLATRRGAIPEVLGPRGGWLIDSPDPRLFAAALEPLLSRPELLESARDGLRPDALSRLSFDAMIQATLAQYREVGRSCRERP